MKFHTLWRLCLVILLAFCFPLRALALDLPGGLEFGQDFPEVETIAKDNGWSLRQSEVAPYWWVIKDMGITLYFCDEVLSGIDQVTDGTFKSFVEMVSGYRFQYGEPDTDVLVLLARSQFEQHTVQSVFNAENGVRISVQLYLFDGSLTLFTRTSDSSACVPQ